MSIARPVMPFEKRTNTLVILPSSSTNRPSVKEDTLKKGALGSMMSARRKKSAT